ncbi:Small heat shock protein chloroplastic [Bienertia sinuspersici]
MATNTLTCSAASSLVSNTRATASGSPVPIGLGPRLALPPNPTWKARSSRASGLVVKAQHGGSPRKMDPMAAEQFRKKFAHVEASPYVRSPWNTSEDEHEIRFWFDMPGLAAENIEVNMVDDFLVIKGGEGVDAFGRKIYSPYDCSIQLPDKTWKEEVTAVFINGVLYVTVPKFTKFEHKVINIPVKTI